MKKLALRVERRRLLSAVIALVLCLPAMIVLSVSSVPEMTDTAVRESPIAARTLALTAHDPILIEGNAGFTGPNATTGVTRGSGTESDPYVIEGWDIQGPRGVTRISILNADVHFVVRNCSLHDSEASSGGSGVALTACSNGTVEYCTSYSHDEGVILRYCVGIIVRDCFCYNNSRGISVSSTSQLCLVTNNTCTDGNQYGIYIENWAGNNSVVRNNCSGNRETGISMGPCWNNTVADNRCDHNCRGFELNSAYYNRLTNNSCTFNDEEGICLFSCEINTFESNNCSSNGLSGIRLVNSNNNTIVGTTIHSNDYCGVLVESNLPWGLSRGNQIANNTIFDNTQWGIIVVAASEFNRIWNNTLIYNNGAMNTYDPSHIQAYDDGMDNSWNSTDGFGNYWSDWTTPDIAPPDGIVDVPYDIAGSAGAKDYHPLTTMPTEPIPEFGMMPFVVVLLLVTFVLISGARRRKAR